ncbi:TPA: hypothetical protein EYP37_05610 [Candidatus Poribacteria bacterium]|nr:hypothetical protein [Candidatus Poribacteria bacterium]
MTKLMTITSLTFYFFALLFGLILFTGRYTYTVPAQTVQGKPGETSAERIKRLDAEIKAKQNRLSKLQGQIGEATRRLNQIKEQIATLEMERESVERGRSLARLYSSMQAEDVASLIMQANDETIDLIVKYAFPYMRDRVLGKVMSSLVKNNPQLAARISKMLAENDSKERSQNI